MSTSIYGLFDPRTGELRYVGKTKKPPIKRLREHVRSKATEQSGLHTARWLRSLREAGFEPEMEVLEVVPDEQWGEAEDFHIQYYRALDCRLTNARGGGWGATWCSDELRQTRSDLARASRAWERLAEQAKEDWVVITPTGEEIEVHGLQGYCLEHGLDPGNMNRVARGLRKQYKGYRCYRKSVGPVEYQGLPATHHVKWKRRCHTAKDSKLHGKNMSNSVKRGEKK